MKKKIFFVLGLVISFNASFGQYQIDALRFSKQNYSGTARSIAMGNSLNAVGADLSTFAVNPAGIAVFKNSQISLTQAIMVSSSTSDFLTNKTNDQRYDYAINNFGFVGAVTNLAGKWTNISFGITYNRLNNFTQKMQIDGNNNAGSILDYYVYNANSNMPGIPKYQDQYGDRYLSSREDLAFTTYMLDSVNGEYYSPVVDAGLYGERQRKVVTKRGGAGEWDFTFGAAYNDMLYFGGTLGVTSVRYISETYYKESNYVPILYNGQEIQPDYMEYNERLTTTGTGLNFKIGVLYQPVKFLRIGGSVHSSSFYSLHEEFGSDMYSKFIIPDNNGNSSYSAPFTPNTNIFDYSLRTPFRANAGVAFILDSYHVGGYWTMPMIFSFGYEYVDYTKSKLTGSNDAFLNDNLAITKSYQPAHNINAGYEINFGVVSGRFGYTLQSSPMVGDSFFENARSAYSAGFGFKGNYAYIDFSYTLAQSTENNSIYGATDSYPLNPIGNIVEPMAKISNLNHFVNITTGIKF